MTSGSVYQLHHSQRILAKLWWGPLRRPFEALVRRLYGHKTVVISGPMKGNHFQGGLAQLLGIYELPIQEQIIQRLRPGHVFYDIGANNGYLSLLAARLVGDHGHVFAFEPLPENIGKIREMIAHNQLCNCTLVAKAVTDVEGMVPLYLSKTGSIATPSLFSDEDYDATITIEAVSLNNFVKAALWPDLIKVDVEGAETKVLTEASHLLHHPRAPQWLIEVHTEDKEADVKQILAEAGYGWNMISTPRQRRAMYPTFLVAQRRT